MDKVEGHDDLIRDDCGSIININTDAYNKYIMLKRIKYKEKEELMKMKSEMAEMKSLLNKLLGNI